MEALQLLKHQQLTDKQAFAELFLNRDNSIKNITIMNQGAVTHQLYLDSEAIKELYIRKDRDYYITVNDLKAHQRIGSNVIAFNGFMVDIDYREKGLTEESALHLAYDIMKEKNIFQPSMIFSSGRGFWLLWKIETVVNGTNNINRTWQQIQSDLVNAFSGIGADPAVTSPNNLMRLPGSVNQKNHQATHLIEYTGNSYTLRNFIDEVSTYDSTQKKRHSGKINHLFNEHNLNLTRYHDIVKFIELRNFDINFQRNVLMFLARNFLNLAGINNAEATIQELNQQLTDPLTATELRNLNKDSKQYHYTNKRLIEVMDITPSEQRQMKTIISSNERARRIKERNRRYYAPIKQKNQSKRQQRDDLVMKLVNQELTNKEVLTQYAKLTDDQISLRTLQNIKTFFC